MKKYFILFILICVIAILYVSFPVNSREHFVSIKDDKFQLNGKDFYPVVVNYLAVTQIDKNGLWACPTKGYNPDDKFKYTTKDSCLMQLKADMELIKEMGFNSVRFIKIGEEDINKKTGELSIYAHIGNKRDTSIDLSSDENYKKYFSALSELFDVVNKAGLKVILLTRVVPDIKTTEEHLRRVATQFKNDTTIMAYDLFNEPLYFDSLLDRSKEDIHRIVKRWKNILTTSAPNQLSTIGLAGIREIFRWDPTILDVDFISFHPYNHEPEQVMNELYWYGHYIKKPWIIGETAVCADNDSVPYEEQRKFASQTLKQAYNCGAYGYSWWQYKDIEWHSFLANYMGVVTRKGETKTGKNNLMVNGTPKPVAEEFKKFNPSEKKGPCSCLANYYNYSKGNKCKLTGYLKDENDEPIKGGVVLGWDQSWGHSYHTTTKEDGSFELLGVFPFYHWIATATMHSVVRGEVLPDTAKIYSDSVPTINMGNLKINKLQLKSNFIKSLIE